MSSSKKAGYSLTEIMVGVAIGGIVMAVIGSQMVGVSKSTSSVVDVKDVELLNNEINQDFDRYFKRGTRIAMTHLQAPNPLPAGFQDYVLPFASTFFKIYGNGVVVIDADLRPCGNGGAGTFDMSNSTSNLSRIIIACCSIIKPIILGPIKMPPDATHPAEWNMPSIPATCANGQKMQPGLYIEVRPPSAINTPRAGRCYGRYKHMHVEQAGFHASLMSELYHFDLLSYAGDNPAISNSARLERRTESYLALGNTGSTTITFCQEHLKGMGP